jgi:hypothetical protein
MSANGRWDLTRRLNGYGRVRIGRQSGGNFVSVCDWPMFASVQVKTAGTLLIFLNIRSD